MGSLEFPKILAPCCFNAHCSVLINKSCVLAAPTESFLEIKYSPEILHAGKCGPLGKLASLLKRLVKAKVWPQPYSHKRREKLKYGSSLSFPGFRTKGLGQSFISHAGEE